jgi:hypothetical protein
MSSRGNGDISRRSHQAPVHEWGLRAPDAFSINRFPYSTALAFYSDPTR